MPFLAINGIELPVAIGGAKKDAPTVIGDKARALSGRLRETHVATKRRWQAGSAHLSTADAEAWRRLLLLDCDSASFDSTAYSARGVAGDGTGLSFVAGGVFNDGLQLAATTGTVTFLFALGSTWSVAVWKSGVHYVVRSDGAKWVDGVRNDAASTTWLSVDVDGDVTIANTTGTAFIVDDLAVFPFLVPTTWPAYIYGAGAAFNAIDLRATGDLIEGAPRTVTAEVGTTDVTVATLDGSFGIVEVLDIQLEER